MTDKIRERLDRLKEAREKATQGEWDCSIGASANFIDNYDVFFARGPIIEKDRYEEGTRAAKTDCQFITLAANEWTNLVEALELAVEAIDCECSIKERMSGHKTDCRVPEVIEQIAKKLGCSNER